jgi:hypothetical protein
LTSRSAATRFIRTITMAGLLALLIAGLASGTTLAARGGGSTSNSVTMVALDSTDGLAYYGRRVTFKVVTSNPYPVVSLTCSQNGTVVYGDSHPMYQPNPWDDQGIFTLASPSWTGGAADCTALLKGTSHGKVVTLASTAFHVYP